MAKERCAKRVFSGERWDTSGHTCGNYALPDSEFCRLHGPQEALADLTRGPLRPPAVETRTQVRYHVTLTWEPGDGPVIAPEHHAPGTFVALTHVALSVDGPHPELEVERHSALNGRGVRLRRSGEVGAQRWDSRYGMAWTLLPESVRAELLRLLALEESYNT